MHTVSKGGIYNPDRARQLRDFRGLRYGNITPTDIDGLIEYKNRGYVLLELKLADNRMPYGQKLALERISDDLERSGKPCLCIIASHYEEDVNTDIDVSNTRVTSYRYKNRWVECDSPRLTKDVIASFFNYLDN